MLLQPEMAGLPGDPQTKKKEKQYKQEYYRRTMTQNKKKNKRNMTYNTL